MIQLWIALARSLAISLGGKIGTVVVQLADTVGLAIADKADVELTIGPWITWINAIIDAKRDLTPEEHAAVNALADAVNQNNISLANNGPPVAIPSPPA